MTAHDLLYRDLTCLDDWLRTAQGIDLRLPHTSFNPAAPEWHSAVADALSMIRQLNARALRDHYQRILEPLPDRVNSAYANLFRHRHVPFGQLADQLRQQPAVVLSVGARARNGRRTASGGTQRSAFPDGAGGVSIDDYGFPGDWEYSIDAEARVTTPEALRTIDALSNAGASGGCIRFVETERDEPWWDPARHQLLVPETFSRLGLRQQIVRLGRSRAWQDVVPPSDPPAHRVSPSRHRSRAVLATLALVHTGKARDYTHYRFNYRIAVLAQSLRDSGVDARARTIEDLSSYSSFVAAYRGDPVDVVVISVYQHKPDDMKLLADLLRDVRAIRPDVFVVLEGVATQPAKQMLALFPGVDMLVRGESEAAVQALLTFKDRGQPLTDAQRYMVLRDGAVRRHGIFLRTRTGGVFSGLDCEQQDADPQLLRPERHMHSVWYSERGCPSTCGYCPLYTGHQSRARVVTAERRIQWMLDRLKLELSSDAAVDDEALRQRLTARASGVATLPDGESAIWRSALRDDTFIGNGKVTITIVSQNALVSRPVWLSFCRQVAALGLHKYFRIKIADTSITTLWRNGAADRELIRALGGAGVFFIGFGTESLSERILNDLRKGHGHKETSDYHADLPIEIAAALHEEGFPVDGVRHNFMSNAPESRLDHVKEGMVLAYIGPLFNHSIDRLGNGWGNSRQNRLYAMEGSLHTAVDSLRYGDSYRFTVPESGTIPDGVSLLGEFFVCHDAPEYMVRKEDGRLTYIDERLQPLTTAFTHPTFYRYAMRDVLQSNVTDDDIGEMRRHWENGSSEELRSLARIVSAYQRDDPRLSNLETLFRVKAHMLCAECFRFTQWEQRLDRMPALPGALERAGISTLIADADDCLRPGAFDPGAALGRQMLAARRARLTEMGYEQVAADPRERAVEDLIAREAELRARGLHTLLSYPDSQQFEDLCRACPSTPAVLLFDLLRQEMRASGACLTVAVRAIVCRELRLRDDEYDDFVKLLKGYDTIPLFAPGGALSSLHCANPATRGRAMQEVRRALDATTHAMMRRFLEHSLTPASYPPQ